MRKLNTGDIFKILQIFKAAGLRSEFAELLNLAFTKVEREEIGSKFFIILFDCLGHDRAEPMIVKLLSDISGETPNVILEQPIAKTIELLKEIVKQNDMNSFFAGAAALT